jgi:hypothetical protein
MFSLVNVKNTENFLSYEKLSKISGEKAALNVEG